METHGQPPRLKGWDYAKSGAYFVTFVVAGRAKTLRDPDRGLTAAGSAVMAAWVRLPELFPRVVLDEIAVMEDHLHAVVFLKPHPADRATLGEVVRAWKASSTREIRRFAPTFRWQSHYQDWVVRSQAGLNRIRRYVRRNLSGT